jgi:hypothetical protein
MASKAQPLSQAKVHGSFAKRMSTHIAYALVAYTLLLIFEVSPQMESKGMSILPYFILVALVGLAILPCRNLERRWQMIDANASGDTQTMFKREVVGLWLSAIGIPTLLMLIIWIVP